MNQTTSVNSCSHELLYYGNLVIIAILFSHSHCVYVRQFLPISSTLVAILWPFSIPPFLILLTKLWLLSCLSNEGRQSPVSITWGLFEWLKNIWDQSQFLNQENILQQYVEHNPGNKFNSACYFCLPENSMREEGNPTQWLALGGLSVSMFKYHRESCACHFKTVMLFCVLFSQMFPKLNI